MRLKAVVLAAGEARRFGASKLTATLGGRPLLAFALDAALNAPAESVVLVTGCHAKTVEACARAIAPRAIAAGRLRIHRAVRAVEGLGASLAAGLSAALPADGVFVFLADMPAVPPGIAAMLAERLKPGVDAVAPSWRGRRGHPVLFGSALLPALTTLSGETGARGPLADLGDRLVRVEAPDDGVLFDVDTADDLARRGTGGGAGLSTRVLAEQAR